MTENEFIETYLKPLCTTPEAFNLSDDAACLTPCGGFDIILSKDLLIEDHHFLKSDSPEDIAHKALAVNLSDIAAKGAQPIGFLLGLAFPNAPDPNWASAFTSELKQMIETYDCPLLGGDTTGTKGPLAISVTILGQIETGKMIRRNTAKPGDIIYVSGALGDAALGFELHKENDASSLTTWDLTEDQKSSLITRYLRPTPRTNLAGALKQYATAAMDISDGLHSDLQKLCDASGLTAEIELSTIPFSNATIAVIEQAANNRDHALTWGDDYEILATIAPENAGEFEQLAKNLGTKVTRIGETKQPAGPVIYKEADGKPHNIKSAAFRHF